MDLIIREMASLSVSEDALKELDVAGLMRDFKENPKKFGEEFKKLGDLEKTRKEHEKRGWLSRWWNSDVLEKAQLDSVELQASFSKKLGQLMAIALFQSQTLNHHQEELQLQQREIKEQTSAIAAANETIKEQQALLADQQNELQKLIKDYFELKGLTINEAKKLIEIAGEIKSTKSDLLAALAVEHEEFVELRQRVDECVRKQAAQDLQMNEQCAQFNQELTRQNEKLANQIASHHETVDARLLGQAKHFSKEQRALEEQLQQFDHRCRSIEHSLARTQEQQVLQQAQLEQRLARLQRSAMLALGGAIAALLWLAWTNRAFLGL